MLIAVAAQAIGIGHALRIEDVPYFVRLMAIHAGRQDMRFFLPKLSANRLPVHFLDFRMTLRAGRDDVPPIDRRIRIGMRQNIVRRVARHAIRSHDEPLFHERFAVNALGIIFENIVLIDSPLRLHRRSFPMATSAHERNFQRSHRRPGILHGNDVMVPMAIDAMRRQGIASRDRLPVQRMRVLFLLIVVACPALHSR